MLANTYIVNMIIKILIGSVIGVGKSPGKEGVNNGPCTAADVSKSRGWGNLEPD